MEFLNKIDKQQVQKITLIVIAALTILALVLLLVIVIASVNPASPFGVAGGIDKTIDYVVKDSDLATGSLILADYDHTYNYAFDASELEVLGTYRDANLEKDAEGKALYKYYMNAQLQMKLTKEAAAANHAMMVAAEKAVGKDDLLISYTYGYNEADKQEYNTAALIFLTNYENGALDKAYASWLDDHAAEYGFVESFENGYRYVGKVHAKVISGDKNIKSLADYIAYLKENTNVGKTIEVELDGATYKVYYVSCNAGDTIKVPADTANTTLSGTNEGGIIVTVKVK